MSVSEVDLPPLKADIFDMIKSPTDRNHSTLLLLMHVGRHNTIWGALTQISFKTWIAREAAAEKLYIYESIIVIGCDRLKNYSGIA